ncbi:MAG: PAS domain-containing protein [Bryobacteraceae bacterium]|nr:PAS domain-containing protein [Bryobacteraceae bacterium]
MNPLHDGIDSVVRACEAILVERVAEITERARSLAGRNPALTQGALEDFFRMMYPDHEEVGALARLFVATYAAEVSQVNKIEHAGHQIAALQLYLEQTDQLCMAEISMAGAMRTVNPAMAQLLKMERAKLPGRSIFDFFVEAERSFLDDLKMFGHTPGSHLVNGRDAEGGVFSLRCRIYPAPDGYLLIAEAARDRMNQLAERLIDLNNHLAVLARENVEQTRLIQRARHRIHELECMVGGTATDSPQVH